MSLRAVALFMLLALVAAPSAVRAGTRAGARLDADAVKRIDALIERAIAAKVTPGAAIAIGRKGEVLHMRGYGRTDWRGTAPRVDERTIYDLASLTKPLATTSAAMLLVQDGVLDLDRPLAAYLPEWRDMPDRRWMTARHLLNHTSGLPVSGPLAGVGTDRSLIIEYLATIRLVSPPGRHYAYSDYGMILLGAVVERLSGERLDALLARRVFEPLGMEDTGFNPLGSGGSPFVLASAAPSPLARIAPTERTSERGHIHGVVHDPLAFRLGGVAGHAGLFGSVRDLARFADMLLPGDSAAAGDVLRPDLVAKFTHRPSAGSRFALGWELARDDNSSGGLLPANAYGHTGFTGTSIWIDPDAGLYIVLLTNRVNPNGKERRHVQLRKDVHAAFAGAIIR